MSEGLGMSAMMETPVVVINCQRAGPSTGVPTKTEQGDLWQMLGAAFGDYPRIIAARLDIGDCFKLIPELFNLADRFQCPGLVLCDLLLSEGGYRHLGKTIPKEQKQQLDLLAGGQDEA